MTERNSMAFLLVAVFVNGCAWEAQQYEQPELGADEEALSTPGNVVSVAKSQLGTLEGTAANKYLTATPGVGSSTVTTPWCAAFVSWVMAQTGASPYRSASVPEWVTTAKAKRSGLSVDGKPHVGDIVAYDWTNTGNFGTDSHVGIVTSVASDTSFSTVEGNTSNPSGGADGVFLKTRSTTSNYVVVFIQPTWSGESRTVSGTASVYGVLSDGRLTYTEIDAASGNRTRGAVTSVVSLGFTPKAMATLNFNTVLITSTGGQLYRVDVNSIHANLDIKAPVALGYGWTHDLLAFDGTYLYGIAGGALRRYRIAVTKPSASDITNNTLIDNGFTLKTMTSTGSGWILGTTSDGKLLSYQIRGASDWSRYELRSSTWQVFTQLLSPGAGVYYGHTGDGAMDRYLDASPFDGKGGDVAGFPDDPVDSDGWSQTLLSAQPNTVTAL